MTQRPNLLVLADKILVMRQGRMELLGPRDEVLAKMGWTPTPAGPSPQQQVRGGPKPLASVQVGQEHG